MLPKFLSPSSRTMITFGLLLPIVLIGIPAFLAFRAERKLTDAFQWVTHTLAVERSVQSLANSLVDAETGQRGFLLTRRELYLEPYESGRARVGQQMHDLRMLTSDNADQQQRLDELQPLVRERLALLDETVTLGKRGEFDAALEMVNSDRGKERMDKIRGLLRVMDEDEHRLLWLRRQAASKQASRNVALLVLVLLASVACGAAVFYLVRRLSKAEPVINMCTHSRTIEFEGEWISFEDYLRRRFNIQTNHGISPAEFDRLRAAVRR